MDSPIQIGETVRIAEIYQEFCIRIWSRDSLGFTCFCCSYKRGDEPRNSNEIHAKYGLKVTITDFDEEERPIIKSLFCDIK